MSVKSMNEIIKEVLIADKLRHLNILTPLHLSKQTLTVPLNCTYVDSGNLNALNLAVRKSPSTVLKFSNRYGSTEQLKIVMKIKNRLKKTV